MKHSLVDTLSWYSKINHEMVCSQMDLHSRQRLISIYPGQFICAMVLISIGPLLDPMMRDLQIPLSRGGLISLGLFLGEIVGIVFLNTVMARVPVKWGLVGGAIVMGLALVVAGAVSRNLISLLASYIFAGIGWAMVNITGWMWVSAHIRKGTAAATLLIVLFFALGMTITPLALGIILDMGVTWRWIMIVEGMLSLAFGFVATAFPLLDILGRENVRPSHIKQIAAHNPGLLMGMLGASFMYIGTETCITVWLPKFQLDTFASSDTWANLSVVLFSAGLVAGRLGFRPLTRRFAPSRLILACGCALALTIVGISLAPTLSISLLLSLAAGLGASASYGLIGSYSGRFPGWQAGIASSLFVLAGGFGGMIFPYLIGPLASVGGLRLALAVTAVPATIFAVFSLLIHAHSRQESQ